MILVTQIITKFAIDKSIKPSVKDGSASCYSPLTTFNKFNL